MGKKDTALCIVSMVVYMYYTVVCIYVDPGVCVAR